MKVDVNSVVESSTKEKVTITIEFNPSDSQQEGMTAMIVAVCDTVRQVVMLQEVIDAEG